MRSWKGCSLSEKLWNSSAFSSVFDTAVCSTFLYTKQLTFKQVNLGPYEKCRDIISSYVHAQQPLYPISTYRTFHEPKALQCLAGDTSYLEATESNPNWFSSEEACLIYLESDTFIIE